MTVQEAIERVRELKPNAYTDEMMCAWLSELDGRVKTEIFDQHAGFEEKEIPAYTIGTRTRELFVPAPYSDIYVYWLSMKIDFSNGEFDRFNNDAVLYNTSWLTFSNHIRRTHESQKQTRIEHV